MNKNKVLGFTLIELLAVIVILAIIALIATPIVLDIVDDVKKSSLIRNVENIESAAEIYVSKSYLNKENLNNNIYNKVMEMVNGKQPDNGIIYANSSGEIAFAIEYDKFCYTKGYNDKDIKAEKIKEKACLVPVEYIMVQNQDNDGSKPVFGGPISKQSIEKVYTVTTNKVPSGVIGSFDVSENKNGSVMAWYKDEDQNGLYELYLGQDGGVKANPDSTRMFNYFINLIEIDLSNFDTSNVTTMNRMFQRCEKIISLNLLSFNTANATDMIAMFQRCLVLEIINLSNFDTSKVTNMQAMFNECHKLESVDVSKFNTSNVTTMAGMFQLCESLKKIDLGNFDTNNVTTMFAMFYMCNALTILDLSNFNTSNVTAMNGMFYGTTNLKTIKLNKAIFTKVTEYAEMFTNTVVENITVKDAASKTFIEARLTDAGKTANVTIG